MRTGWGAVVAGIAVLVGQVAGSSATLPLPGGWHVTLYPTGVGVLLLTLGVCLLAIAGLRSTVGRQPPV
jgi:hypothetical protein